MIRTPLSLGPCENNAFTTASGIVAQRYPAATRCSQLALDANNLRLNPMGIDPNRMDNDSPDLSRGVRLKMVFWSVCAIATPIAAKVASRRFSIPIVAITAFFFFAVCLKCLFQNRQALRNITPQQNPIQYRAKREKQIYDEAHSLLDAITFKLNAINTVFPEGTIQNGKITQPIEINEALVVNLDRWIDWLRFVHGWNDLTQNWQPVEPRLLGAIENRRRLVVNESFRSLTTSLLPIINKIEVVRRVVILSLNPNNKETMTRASNTAFRQLLEMISRWETARRDIQRTY